MIKILENLEKYILYIVVGVFPVFVLPYFASPFVVPKEILLITISMLALISWFIRNFLKGSTSWSIGKFDLGVILIALAYLVSGIFQTPNKMEAFFFPGASTFVIAAAIVYFLVNQLEKKEKNTVLISFLISGILLSLTLFFTQLGIFAKIPQLPSFLRDSTFNPLSGAVPSLVYLLSILPVAIILILKEKDIVKKTFFAVSTAIVIFGVFLMGSTMLPNNPQAPKFPSVQTSWEVSIEALKKSPILGVGPANYLTAFNIFRPLAYNQTDIWAVRFTTASNFYFTLLTEVGFVGLIAFAVLILSVYKSFSGESKWDKLPLLFFLVLLAFLPTPPQLLFILFILLAVYSASENKSVSLVAPESTKAPLVLAGIPVLAAVIAIIFFGTKVLAAEITFKGSLDALGKNDAKLTYDLMTKAVNQNSKVDRYHASLAQVDMALASSLAAKKDLTDQDKKTVTQLVQQAINEGKNTVILNPQRSGNWELLGQIYKNIMPFATGADEFAIQTYTQAVALDPNNPNLRIALGGVYYALGRYDEAIDAFKLAVLSKPDLANAHYNLAVAYREKKELDRAIAEMNAVLTLVAKDSPDYTLAQTTLEELEKNKSTKNTEGTDNLQAPQPVGESNINPPIELPEEATPPTN